MNKQETYMDNNGNPCSRPLKPAKMGPVGTGLVTVAYELKATGDTVFETAATVPEGFYGKITLSFENGKLTMINKSQNIKPGVK